jgi:membrane AbrB-like protein
VSNGAAQQPAVWWRFGLALLIGIAGGVVFSLLRAPLPWMLGPMVFNTAAAMLGAPITSPNWARPFMVPVIGVLLGAGFTPALLGQVSTWLISLAFLAGFLVLTGLAVVPFYRYLAGFDWRTAFFAGMPGGLNEMVVIGQAMGADERRVSLAHASRILIVVFAISFWFRFTEHVSTVRGDPLVFPFDTLALGDLLVLSVAAVLGFILGRRLGLPAPTMIGPMALSALAHMTGLTAAQPPAGLVQIAQLVLGTVLGCRFAGTAAGTVLKALLLSVGATGIMLLITAGFVLVTHLATGQGTSDILLAFSPGGLTEMSLIALALHTNTADVATHHIVRITLVILFAPLVFRWLFGRQSVAVPSPKAGPGT